MLVHQGKKKQPMSDFTSTTAPLGSTAWTSPKITSKKCLYPYLKSKIDLTSHKHGMKDVVKEPCRSGTGLPISLRKLDFGVAVWRCCWPPSLPLTKGVHIRCLISFLSTLMSKAKDVLWRPSRFGAMDSHTRRLDSSMPYSFLRRSEQPDCPALMLSAARQFGLIAPDALFTTYALSARHECAPKSRTVLQPLKH